MSCKLRGEYYIKMAIANLKWNIKIEMNCGKSDIEFYKNMQMSFGWEIYILKREALI